MSLGYVFFLRALSLFVKAHLPPIPIQIKKLSISYILLAGSVSNLQFPNFQSRELLGRKMAQTPESIKGGGGSIKLGTTGTISSLMTRELDQISSAPHKQVPSRSKPRTLPVSVACGSTTPKRLQPRKSSDEASSSGGSNNTNHRSPGKAQKPKSNGRRSTHRIPILGSDNFPVDRSPARGKNDKKIPNIVEVVDIKCGNADKAWATPLTSRLKKLGFSKLSESII